MKTRIWIALLAIYLVWGSTYLAIRNAVASMPPFLMAGTRFLMAGSILVTWRFLAGDPRPTRRQVSSATIIGLLLLLGGNGLLSWAEQHIPSGIAALLIAAVPLFMVLVEALRPHGSKPGWQSILGLIAGFGGIALLIGPGIWTGTLSHTGILAIAGSLLAAMFWSIGSVYSQDADLPTSSLMGTGLEMLFGGIGLYLVGTLVGEWQAVQISAITVKSWLSLAYLVVFGSLIGYVAYTWLLRNAPIPLVATYAFVNPLVAIGLGAWFGQEHLDLRSLIAALVIVSSVILITTSRQARIVQQDKTASPAAE